MVAIGQLLGDSASIVPKMLAGATNAPVETPDGQPEGDPAAEQRTVSPSIWMAAAFTLTEGLVNLGFNNQMAEGLIVPLSAQQWIDVSHEIAARDPGNLILPYLTLQDIDELNELLAQQVEPSQLDENVFYAVRTAMSTRSRPSMSGTANEIFSHLYSTNHLSGDQVAWLMQMMRSARSADLTTHAQHAELVENGYYLHHLYSSASDSHAEAVGECMFAFLTAVPDAREPTQANNSPHGYELLKDLFRDSDTIPGVVEHFTILVRETHQLSMAFQMATGKLPVPTIPSAGSQNAPFR